jgi:hypothetical protein
MLICSPYLTGADGPNSERSPLDGLKGTGSDVRSATRSRSDGSVHEWSSVIPCTSTVEPKEQPRKSFIVVRGIQT